MSNVNRHLAGDKLSWYVPVESATVVEIGDMGYLSSGYFVPAGSFTWDTNLATTQRAFILAFLGISGSRSQSGETDEIVIERGGTKRFNCVSATFNVGDLVGLAKATGDALEPQKVVAVASHDLAIGTIARDYSSAVTEVYVDIFSRSGMLKITSDQILDEINNNATSGYRIHLGNFSAAVAPGVGDDSADGYSVGSIWIDTTADNEYVCVDSTVGAAVWLRKITAAEISKLAAIEAAADVTDSTNVAAAGAVMDSDISPASGIVRKTGAGGYEALKTNLAATTAPGVGDDSDDDYAVGSIWIDTTADECYICVDSTVGAAVWNTTVKAAEKAKLQNLGVSKLFVIKHLVAASEDSEGYVDIDTGFGVSPSGFMLMYDDGMTTVYYDCAVSDLATGVIRVADGATNAVSAGVVITLIAWTA